MGHLITISYDDLLPGEPGLNEKTLYNVLIFAESGRKLAPVPIRKIDKYVHLDGRHRLIYHYLTDTIPDFYLADHESDHMLSKEFDHIDYKKIDEINRNIWGMWNRAVIVSRQLNVENYHEHFKNLREQYKFLKDFETCKAYLNSKLISA